MVEPFNTHSHRNFNQHLQTLLQAPPRYVDDSLWFQVLPGLDDLDDEDGDPVLSILRLENC